MKLHCLGTAGYHPNRDRDTSCYAIPECGLVLDAGTGMFRLPEVIETDYLDIVLSHAHLDHIVGLTFLLDILHQRPVEDVRIWGEAKKLEAVRTHLFSEHIFPVELNVEWCPIEAGHKVELTSGAALASFLQNHPGGSLGFRFDFPMHEKSLAYVTDTTAQLDDGHLPSLHGVDLLMHECNFRDSAQQWAIKTGHSWTSRACEIAAKVNAKSLLLIHINPLEASEDPVDIAQARSIFPATQVAIDELCIEY